MCAGFVVEAALIRNLYLCLFLAVLTWCLLFSQADLQEAPRSSCFIGFFSGQGSSWLQIANMRYWNFLRMSAGLRRFLAVNLAVIADVQIDVAE